jgi:two-component system response regulator AtoC
MDILARHSWPGNVRELENIVERAMVLTESDIIGIESMPDNLARPSSQPESTFDFHDLSIKKATRAIEQTLILRALEQTRGNRTAAARLLELSHRALLYKLKEYFPDGVPGEQ